MYYAIAAICISLVILALIGKPLRIEIIHTVTPPPAPPAEPETPTVDPKAVKEMADVMEYINTAFHNVEAGEKHG